MLSLQNQYNLLLEGKFAKDVFLKNAKALFPQYIPNHYGFELTTKILKQKSVLTEGYIDLEPLQAPSARPKEDFETKFENFLNEEKKAKDANEKKIKADLKKTDKSVEDVQDNDYDQKNLKNVDNVIYHQLQQGVYIEMNKNPDIDLQKAKDIVLKNLTKDPIYYTKNSAFGLEIEGYTDKLPGATASKSDKMEPVTKEKVKSNVKDGLTKTESAKKGSKPKEIKSEMTQVSKTSKGVKKMDMPGKEKIIKLKEGMGLADLLEGDDDDHREGNIIVLKDDPSMDVKAGNYTVVYYGGAGDGPMDELIYILKDENGKEIELTADYIEGKGYWKNGGIGVGRFSQKNESINEENKQHTEDILFNFKKDFDEASRDKHDIQYAQETVVDNYKSKYSKYPEIIKGIEEFYSQNVSESFQSMQKRFKESLDVPKPSFATRLKEAIKKVLEGPLEDTDAQLAKAAADAEAKLAAVEKQKADNKLKIANANKNV